MDQFSDGDIGWSKRFEVKGRAPVTDLNRFFAFRFNKVAVSTYFSTHKGQLAGM